MQINLKAILVHIVYRILRSVFMLIANIYYQLSGEFDGTIPIDKVQISRIIFRHKISEADMTGANDFVWVHEKIDDENVLDDPHCSLYTIDKHFAYFVYLPKPNNEYTVNVAPFIYMQQFVDAQRVAKCSLDTFVKYCENRSSGRGPVVYISSVPRSGSTLMCQLLQATGKATVFGEPDSFTALTNLVDKKQIDDADVDSLVGSIFAYLCKEQRENEIYIFKTQANAIRLVPYIKRVFPNIKHFFTFRKDTRHVLKSLEKITRHGSSGDEIVWLWNNISPKFAVWLINYGSYEYAMVKRYGMSDCLDYTILQHVSPYCEFIKNRQLFDLPWVVYEDVRANPRETLLPILELCGIPSEYVQQALTVFNQDSQAGTVLSQDNMKDVKWTEMSEERIAKTNAICDDLKIPRLEF